MTFPAVTHRIGVEALREQVSRMGLDRYAESIGLGGKEVPGCRRGGLRRDPRGAPVPFSGLRVGQVTDALGCPGRSRWGS